uniref:Cyclin-T n=1 Tax=Aceria tosichella TaxID=561515 RepID=A0A6G1S9K0_9ACAR
MSLPTTNNISRWMFSEERLKLTPSIRLGMTEEQEMEHRQAAATLIRLIGTRLKEAHKKPLPNTQCISTAMVFMQRFYVFHSFQKYSYKSIVPCALYLAAKVEEQPIKLEYIIRTTALCLNPNHGKLDKSDKKFEALARELTKNENLLLQTIGFDLYIQHPHQMVIEWGEKMGAPRETQKLAFDLVSNSLHFSTMCLRFKPQTMAVVCLGIALKACSLGVEEQSEEGKEWWKIFDPELSFETKEKITADFLATAGKHKNFNRWIEKPSLENVNSKQ